MNDDASQGLLELLLAPGGPLDPGRASGWFSPTKLKAPFPWFGGKSRAAALIWSRLGHVVNYVEPFYGSGAVLLGRPHEPRVETVNDVDGMLVNFWRALRAGDRALLALAIRLAGTRLIDNVVLGEDPAPIQSVEVSEVSDA